jgi:hypothetical protein
MMAISQIRGSYLRADNTVSEARASIGKLLSALEATTREADESFSEIDTYESEHNTALIKQYTEKLAEIATTVADAAAVAKAGCAKQDELTNSRQSFELQRNFMLAPTNSRQRRSAVAQ